MSKRTYEDLKELLTQEVNAITKKGDITKDSLDNLYKLTATLKYVSHLMKEGESEGGYSMAPYRTMPYSMNQGSYDGRGSYDGMSNRGSYDGMSNRGSYNQGSYRGSYDGRSMDGQSRDYSMDGNSMDGRRGRDGDSDGRYSEEGSYRRGRDARGRYTSNDSYDGYSRHTEKERMIEKLRTMADSTGTEKERMAIMRCIDQLEG